MWHKALRVDVHAKPLWGKACRMLSDGTYDAVVVDASDAEDGAVRVELALASGAGKGEVVAVRGRFAVSDPIELLGLPATLTVAGGEPRVTVEGVG